MALSINAESRARDVVVIGASSGGIPAVTRLLSRLPEDLQAFIGVVIHRGDKAPSNWSSMLGRRTRLRVVEPAQGETLTRGVVNIAPSDCHMTSKTERFLSIATSDDAVRLPRLRPHDR